MGIDCLVEVTAIFYKKGDKVSFEEIEGCDYPHDLVDSTEDIVEPTSMDNLIHTMEKRLDPNAEFNVEQITHALFIEDALGYTFKLISEGIVGLGYTSGVASEVDAIGWHDVMDGFCDALKQDAIKAMEEARVKWEITLPDGDIPGQLEMVPVEPNPDEKAIRFIVALSYSMEYSGRWGEGDYEADINYLGRIKLHNIKV
jgi:hypothetical protein